MCLSEFCEYVNVEPRFDVKPLPGVKVKVKEMEEYHSGISSIKVSFGEPGAKCTCTRIGLSDIRPTICAHISGYVRMYVHVQQNLFS